MHSGSDSDQLIRQLITALPRQPTPFAQPPRAFEELHQLFLIFYVWKRDWELAQREIPAGLGL